MEDGRHKGYAGAYIGAYFPNEKPIRSAGALADRLSMPHRTTRCSPQTVL